MLIERIFIGYAVMYIGATNLAAYHGLGELFKGMDFDYPSDSQPIHCASSTSPSRCHCGISVTNVIMTSVEILGDAV